MPSLGSSSSLLSTLDGQCIPLKLTVFNVETNKFIEIFKVDTEILKKECVEVVSNPLLHCFRNTLNDDYKFEVCIIIITEFIH